MHHALGRDRRRWLDFDGTTLPAISVWGIGFFFRAHNVAGARNGARVPLSIASRPPSTPEEPECLCRAAGHLTPNGSLDYDAFMVRTRYRISGVPIVQSARVFWPYELSGIPKDLARRLEFRKCTSR